jgi:hypothetical protein
MFESKALRVSDALTGELSQTDREREVLLAALAAALVEHRKKVNPDNGRGLASGTGGNWRTMARWEQLRE